MVETVWAWILFNLFIFSLLVLDLGVFHRKAHVIQVKEALIWSGVWISIALLFNLGIFFYKGPDLALQFLTGYLLEESLSIDNLFIFIQIFSYFRVEPKYQHTVLFWGIVGVVVMRAIFIFGGVALIHYFEWIIYVFGTILILTGIKMARGGDKEIQPERNPIIRLFRKFIPVVSQYEDAKFIVKRDAKVYATPLLVVLLVIEMTDLVFAIDSIPAVLAISKNSFIVYSSNLFAVLGLRSLYFALAGIMPMFYYLRYGLSVILVFIGIKMLSEHFIHVPIGLALGFIVVILFFSILASAVRSQVLIKKANKE